MTCSPLCFIYIWKEDALLRSALVCTHRETSFCHSQPSFLSTFGTWITPRSEVGHFDLQIPTSFVEWNAALVCHSDLHLINVYFFSSCFCCLTAVGNSFWVHHHHLLADSIDQYDYALTHRPYMAAIFLWHHSLCGKLECHNAVFNSYKYTMSFHCSLTDQKLRRQCKVKIYRGDGMYFKVRLYYTY